MNYRPGVVNPGDGSAQKPIAVVSDSAHAVTAYVEAARIGPWVWVRRPEDVRGLSLGGAAMLDGPVSDELRDELAVACLG